MLVKTHRRPGEEPQPRSWVTQLGAREKVMSTLSSREGYEPVSSMSESTVVVYYQCQSIAASKQEQPKMRGARRVITFCLLTACIPVMLLIIPLYLRNTVFAERHYSLLKHDVIPLDDGISSCFCQRHTVQALEGRLSAFPMTEEPVIGPVFHDTVTESKMVIPDDKLEYWGFELLPNSTITLAVCASTPGARLLIVKGEKNLEICGLLTHRSIPKPTPAKPVLGIDRVKITFQEDEDEPAPVTEDENTGGEVTDPSDVSENTTHLVRHLRSKLRHARSLMPSNPTTKSDIAQFEGGIEHGGNTDNFTVNNIDDDGGSSVSSFESELLDCFSGKTLFQNGFKAGGKACETANSNWTGSLILSHTVIEQGHFYFVFYSDNDLEINTINARFLINASTYDFTPSLSPCINSTLCKFDLKFFGGDGTVYIEAVTDVTVVSMCEPRLIIYLLFPVCALLCVLIFGLL